MKLKLQAKPTFDAEVRVPVAGGDAVPVRMTFRHRTKTQLEAFVASRVGTDDKPAPTDLETFLDMVIGWELDDAFGPETAAELIENYAGAGLAAFRTYVDELLKAKSGN